MKIKYWALATALICLNGGVHSQPFKDSRFQMGVNGGLFRISVDRFNEFYGNRVGYPIGGSFGVAVSSSFQIVVRGKYFQKRKTLEDGASGQKLERIWQESWLDIGIQQYSFSLSGNMRSYYGFGLAFFFIKEKKDGDFLSHFGYGNGSVEPKGFYLSLGFDRFLTRRLTFNFDIELSSAGVGKGSSLEAQSIGGIYAGIGFNLFLF